MTRHNETTLSIYAMVLAAAFLLAPAGLARASDAPESQAAIEETRLLLERWGEVRRAIAKEKSDWTLAKDMLEGRIDQLKRTIEETEEQIKAQKQKLWGFDEKVHALEKKNNKLKQATDRLTTLIEQMEGQTIALVKGAPQPLVEGVKPLAVQLPGYSEAMADKKHGETQEPAKDQPSGEASQAVQEEKEQVNTPPLARRVENVVGVLYLFNRFAGKVEQASELVSRQDGTSLSVDAIYLGTSYGYYIDQGDQAAAAGWSSPTGWAWSETGVVPERVRQVIEVFNKDQPAAFVGLPVEVK